MNYEFDIIEQKCRSLRVGYSWELMNFNTLHKYIVDNFTNGVYKSQEIPLTKDDIVQILNFLNKEMSALSTIENQKIFINDGIYSYNIAKAFDIFSIIVRVWDDDYVVWYEALLM